MSRSLEEKLGIIAVAEAIKAFQEKYPESDCHKLQIEHEGPYFKYEMVGNDDNYKNTLELNAQTGTSIKERQKPLKEKDKDPTRRDRKALNLESLMSLTEINQIALDQVETEEPFQWELDRVKERTVWKIELADSSGENITEVKIDAQDGTVVQKKLKS